MRTRAPSVMLLGTSLAAVSGVSTHLNQLFRSRLAEEFTLLHFQVGSEGRQETPLRKMARLAFSPMQFMWRLLVHRPDIVHLNTSMELKSYWRDLVYLLIARAMGKKIVYQVHGGALPQVFFKDSPLLTRMLKRILRWADVVVLLAEEELQAYRNFSPGLSLALVPNAIEPGADPAWKDVSSANKGVLQVAYVGRIAETKGVFDIVEALGMLQCAGRQPHLVIAGSGPDEARLRARVGELGLDHMVRFAGVVRAEEKERLWREADLFAFPTYHEGLPYALLESMAARTPPVVSAVGAIPDVVQDGVHGLFVSPHDPHGLAEAIRTLDDDRALLRRMGEAARRRIESYYTVERLVRDFRRIYRQLCFGKDGA